MGPFTSQNLAREEQVIQSHPTCFNGVGQIEKCTACGTFLIRHGRTKAGKQRFFCRNCRSSKIALPSANGYGKRFNSGISQLTIEGFGIRSIARVLKISPATVVRKILQIAESIAPSEIEYCFKKFQVDELHTYVGNKKKEICIIFSWNNELKRAFSLCVGTRSKANLRMVTDPLVAAGAINTDRYSGYVGVVPKKIHTTIKRRNNHIERQNLNLRTHLKRLNRRTICFSKSAAMLLAVVKIYFWG